MCGIVEIVGDDGGQSVRPTSLLERLKHRGPDDRGTMRAGESWMGYRRLAIVDPLGGRQPLTNEAGDLHLVCNGEIYNHEALRQEPSGHRFRSRSDCEVVLHLAEEGDPLFPRRLNGLFAFVITGENLRLRSP